MSEVDWSGELEVVAGDNAKLENGVYPAHIAGERSTEPKYLLSFEGRHIWFCENGEANIGWGRYYVRNRVEPKVEESMSEIDWSKLIELMDGTPVHLDPEMPGPDSDGDYWVVRDDGEKIGQFPTRCFHEDGSDEHDGSFHIRNRADFAAAQPAPAKTLRDEFAMAALTGMLANPECDTDRFLLGRCAYEYADAMMAERKKGIEQ